MKKHNNRLTNYPERVILFMEKRRPHYDLKAILAHITCAENMNLTMSAQQGIRAAGMTRSEAFEVIHQLSVTNFYNEYDNTPESSGLAGCLSCKMAGQNVLCEVSTRR